MKLVTRKSEIKVYLGKCVNSYNSHGLVSCVDTLEKEILSHRVKFPLLEFSGKVFFEVIPEEDQILFCDRIEKLKTEGGNVILGILLQKRLEEHFEESIKKAVEYISQADIWYVCDIIGERVFGYSLLNEPEKTLPKIKDLSTHESNWVVRSLGAGSHYAIKKGLGKEDVSSIFKLLLTMANTKDKEIRQGVGWAAKTTAKFHPEIIDKYKEGIENTEKVANWFRTKIQIGLNRNKYA